jgi:hypothetical protein
VVIVVLCACGGRDSYQCATSAQCVANGEAGTCETSGYCSFADSDCASGRKYEPAASDGLGGQCVDDGPPPPDAAVCGAVDQACCASEPACSPNTSCTSGMCRACVREVAFGRHHSCVLKHDGTVWCVGENANGQIGFGLAGPAVSSWMQARDGTTSIPITDAISIGAGAEHTCAIRANGGVWCWGRNANGELGNDTTTANAPAAVQVRTADGTPLAGAVRVEGGNGFTCALDGDGGVWCWGLNASGTLGSGATSTPRPHAAPVVDGDASALAGAVELTVARQHACVRKANDETWCWGRNVSGEFGDGAPGVRPAAVMAGMTKSVDAGSWAYTCRVNADGTAACSGSSWRSRLGNGANNYTPGVPDINATPVQVLTTRDGPPLANVAQIIVGGAPCARLTDGTVWCWGDNPHGVTGLGTGSPFPLQVRRRDGTPLDGVVKLAGHYSHTCAFRGDGEIACWGRNTNGEMGTGETGSIAFPQPLAFSCP